MSIEVLDNWIRVNKVSGKLLNEFFKQLRIQRSRDWDSLLSQAKKIVEVKNVK